MVTKLLALLFSFCLFVNLGGGVVIMQTVAWARMISEFSRQDSVQVALQKTFDGEHPCRICKDLAGKNGKGQQLISAQQVGENNLLPPLRNGLFFETATLKADRFARSQFFPSPIYLSPPTPPPRQG